MIHMIDRHCLSRFPVVIVRHIVVLLLLTHFFGGQSTVIGSSQPIVALVGGEVILPCHLETAVSAVDLTVEWARADLKPRFIYLRREGVNQLTELHPSYMSRTSLSDSVLKRGDASLILSRVKLSDAGTYKCLVPKAGKESVVELFVGAVSSPAMAISKVGSGVVLQCESGGWYPEPEVLWLDSEGNLLSAEPTETVRGSDDLYTVSSRMTLEKRHSNRFTCRVQQSHINQTRETQIHVSDDLFMVPSSSPARIIISVFVCSLCALIFVLVAWKISKTQMHQDKNELEKKKNTTLSNSTELQLLIEGDREREHAMTERERFKYLDRTKDKLKERSTKNEEEQKHVEEVIKTLVEQKTNLKTQREKLNSLQQEVNTKTEEIRKKLKETPKLNKDKKMEKREKNKTELGKRQTELQELLTNTGQLMETTEKMINGMTKKKGQLEHEQEQLTKQMNEIKKLMDEVLEKEKSKTEEKKQQAVLNDSTAVTVDSKSIPSNNL